MWTDTQFDVWSDVQPLICINCAFPCAFSKVKLQVQLFNLIQLLHCVVGCNVNHAFVMVQWCMTSHRQVLYKDRYLLHISIYWYSFCCTQDISHFL